MPARCFTVAAATLLPSTVNTALACGVGINCLLDRFSDDHRPYRGRMTFHSPRRIIGG